MNTFNGYEIRFRVKLNVLESVFKIRRALMRHVIEMLNRNYARDKDGDKYLVQNAYEESIYRIDKDGKDVELLEYEYSPLGKALVGAKAYNFKKFPSKKSKKK